jgi:hypothetical protein
MAPHVLGWSPSKWRLEPSIDHFAGHIVALPAISANTAFAVQTAAAPVTETNLLLISVFAFVAVFAVLAVLATIMKVLTLLFPPPPEGSDATLFAACG